jgi:membrane fusion protein, multidrug efflux system
MKKLIVGLVLVGVLIGAVVWRRTADAGDERDDAKATAQVSVVPAERQSVERDLVAYGAVEPSGDGMSSVTLSYDCIVESVIATVGSRVSKGSTLLVINPSPDARLQLESARSLAALATRSLVSSRQRYDLRLGTQDDLRVAEQGAEDAKLKLESLERRGLADGDHPLVAPADGILVKMDAVPGASIPAGTSIASVARSDSLGARLGIEPSDSANVRPGQRVTLTSLSRQDSRIIESQVASVGVVADAGTGTLDVRVPLPKGGDWYPGEHIEAHFEVERRIAMVVPSGAILPEGGADVVYTIKGGKAVRHVVQSGIHSGNVVEISHSDIVPGDAVVVQGNYELSDGMDVSLPDSVKNVEERAPEGGKR